MLKKTNFKKPNNRLENTAGEVRTEKCAQCKKVLSEEELKQESYVCPRCGSYPRLGARKRIAMLADEGSFCEHAADIQSADLLNFPHYKERLARAGEESGEAESVVCGTARIMGFETALFVMDPFFLMGSMGSVTGEKITRLFEYALKMRLPVVGITVSGGARMQEGIFSLMQMAKTSGAVKKHSDAGLLYVALLTDPTTGGVTASFAMEADITLAEPGALIGFAGPRVIEQATRKKLPAGFQRAEFLLEKGFIDIIAGRKEQREILSQILALHKA